MFIIIPFFIFLKIDFHPNPSASSRTASLFARRDNNFNQVKRRILGKEDFIYKYNQIWRGSNFSIAILLVAGSVKGVDFEKWRFLRSEMTSVEEYLGVRDEKKRAKWIIGTESVSRRGLRVELWGEGTSFFWLRFLGIYIYGREWNSITFVI